MNRDITVVIPTSPIRSHPDTTMLEKCIEDIRVHLPDSEIIVMIDGIRSEQEYLRTQYDEYKTRVLWKSLHQWNNVLPIVYEQHMHQSGMMHDVLKKIKTPLILYVEHDTPLTPDRPINWEKCKEFIYSGEANTIRFHFENVIPTEHEGLMIGEKDGFMRTYQWSQRPHLSSVIYYEQVMSYFPITARTMIEDLYHGIVMNDWYGNGRLGWNKHRLWIYYPPEGNIQRSYNMDGRGDEEKYEMTFK
jgi:hypothetical protein